MARQYNLWTGAHNSRLEVDHQPVTVETCVHPVLGLIAVRAESPLLRDRQLVVALDFPYPNANSTSPWAGEWNRPGDHASKLTLRAEECRADIHRSADAATYHVRVARAEGCAFTQWSGETSRKKLAIVTARSGRLEFVCAFSGQPMDSLPTVKETEGAAAAHWKRFWNTGGAIDLSQRGRLTSALTMFVGVHLDKRGSVLLMQMALRNVQRLLARLGSKSRTSLAHVPRIHRAWTAV